MIPSRLYIRDFMCYDDAFVDFNEFSAALIVGKMEHNDTVSNGVGKTTIFRAIEYVLFNHSDVNLENIIRDDAPTCSITLDFVVDGQEYRATRKRTRKSSDLSLFRRTAQDGTDLEALHSIDSQDRYTPVSEEKYWKEITGRRAADTEKELGKLIKANLKSFRIFVHFMQHDFSGLTTATPEKRKLILKEALNLGIYSKLEKMAKDKSGTLIKESDRVKTLIESIGDPDKELTALATQMAQVEVEVSSRQSLLDEVNANLSVLNDKVNQLTTEHSNMEGKFSTLVAKEQSILNEKAKLDTSIKEYKSKRINIIKAANELVEEIKSLEAKQLELVALDYHQIDILNEEVSTKNQLIAQQNIIIQTNVSTYEELKIPMPVGSECKSCRTKLTAEHKKFHQEKIDRDMAECQRNIQNSKNLIADLNVEILAHKQTINSLNLSKQQLDGINTKISTKKKEFQDKQTFHQEYLALLEKFTNELAEKDAAIEQVREELKNSTIEEAKLLQKQIESEKRNIATLMAKVNALTKEINHFSNNKAVVQHSIEQRVKDKQKKLDLQKSLLDLETKLGMYPAVIQAFSSTGIPNLIIQNVLDDLQIEANNLLAQLKPGLQLAFAVEKTMEKTGEQADTLDILYHVNGKKRYYEQLSGAMQLAVTFSLKLGLSFLLQKMIGVDIKFLLLDEIDQSLDKASVDSFADIVKFFQKDFKILVITHNDRLKDKFSHAVLVEQDINMVSRARVVSSW